jgi:hypothetical protein
MTKNLKPTDNSPGSQIGRFIETVRALGCDEDKERFEAALEAVAKHKPSAGQPKLKKKRPDKASGRSS